jgi:hypothetical protein
MHLGQVIERTGLLRERKHILPAIVRDLDKALFDIDVRGPVLPHGAELNEMRLRAEFLHCVEQVQRTDHVVGLGENGMLAVDHRIRGAALLAEMNDRIGSEPGHDVRQEIIVLDVSNVDFDLATGQPFPQCDALG